MFYVLYLLTLAAATWFLLFYTGVPSWVWILFGTAIAFLLMGVLFREFLLVQYVTSTGQDLTPASYRFWFWVYILIQLIALTLLILGLIFTITFSSVPWWVWITLGLGVALIGFTDIVFTLAPNYYWTALISAIIGVILLIGGAIAFALNTTAPGWVSAVLGAAIIFAILALIFEALAPGNVILVEPYQVARSPMGQPIMGQPIQTVLPPQTVVTQPQTQPITTFTQTMPTTLAMPTTQYHYVTYTSP